MANEAMEYDVPIVNDPDNKYCLANLDIEKKIGKGQFSEVFRAKQKDDQGNIIALKKVQV